MPCTNALPAGEDANRSLTGNRGTRLAGVEPAYGTVIAGVRTLWRIQGLTFTITGTEHLPATGGAVVAINHTGYLDFTFAGLPEPEVDIHLTDADGRLRYRLDLGFRETRLAIEYDGRWHHTDEQRQLDEVRRHDLGLEGWTFLIVTADDLYGDTASLLRRIIETLADHGIALPRAPLDDWRRHFRCPTHAPAA